MGFTYQMLQFQEERLWAAANAVQALLNCIEQTADYTRERQAFGGRSSTTRWCTSAWPS